MNWLSTLPHCALYGKPILSALHIGGDLLVFLSYMLIPFAIEWVRRRKALPFNFLAFLFTLFILLCGLGHLLDVTSAITGSPTAYWVEGLTGLLTGCVSILTAMYALRLRHTIIKMPTLPEWQETQELLKKYRDAERWRLTGKPLP